MLKIGDKAPDFSLKDQDGRTVRLSDFTGKRVILYFYPKDDTPGCTREACDFRDQYRQFQTKGAVILGVSRDTESSHKRFQQKYDLPFPLLADDAGTVTEAYGVWVEKSMYGKTYFGIERSTFVIDGTGTITDAIRKVKVEGHAQELLANT